MTRPLVFGSSHIAALRKAPGDVPFDFKQIAEFETKHKLAHLVDGRPQLLPAVAAWLAENPRRDMVVSISGHNYLDLCLTQSDPPFDIVLPWRPELAADAQAQLVPLAEMRAVFEARITYVLDGVAALAAWRPPGVRLWWLEPPPPIGDNGYLRDWLAQTDSAWTPHRDGTLSPPGLRMKMYLLQRQVVRERCLANGVDYIFHPPSAADAAGFLKTEYALDVCHGNSSYGRLAISSVLEALQGASAAEPAPLPFLGGAQSP